MTDQPPAEFYSKLRIGLRGEFRSESGPAVLYISGVDGKLHLRGADHGTWSIDEQRRVLYEDLDNDGYIDRWVTKRIDPTEPNREIHHELNVGANFVVFSDGTVVEIRTGRLPATVYETLPPTTTEEWEALGTQLNTRKPIWEGDDLEAMLAGVSGPEMVLLGASMRHYRPSG